jgi:hypothetical protein
VATVYHATFIGRTKGAIGIDYTIRHLTAGDTEDAARLKLYDWFENLHDLTMRPLTLRYVVIGAGEGAFFYPRQGQYTFETVELAQLAIDAVRAHNTERDLEKWGGKAGLRIQGWWCWPRHFDPAVPDGWPDL